ncbi:MAG: hypothetical protein QOJ76_2505 [Acidobacteriota bacterium]|nr:hypothetical protein [Acidobacteriota bacterium]
MPPTPAPRTARRTLPALLLLPAACALCVSVGGVGAHAQESRGRDAKTTTRGGMADATRGVVSDAKQDAQQSARQGAQRKANAEAARRRREVREAIAALMEVAEAARSFEDLYENVRTQSEAADALWPYDEQWARAILRRAWEAANAPGAEDHVQGFGTSEDPREDAREALTTTRSLVVKTALKHDSRMADAFMREFERGLDGPSTATQPNEQTSKPAGERPPARGDERNTVQDGEQKTAQDGEQSTAHEGVGRADSDASTATPRRERRPSPAAWQRLFIARQLVAEGDFKHAADAVAPLAGEGASLPFLKFILDLRAHEAHLADALYLRLLGATRADAGADANDVLLLSTPVVSPGLRVSVNPDGSAAFVTLSYENEEARRAASTLPAGVRLAFFDTAAFVLLRTRATGGGIGGGVRSDDESAALYFAVGRLLPFFEREAAQFAPALHARLTALASEMDAGARGALAAKMDVSSLSSRNPSDPLAFALQQVAHASDAAGRDFARLIVVSQAARFELWERARAASEEIEDGETRRVARLVIAIRQVASTSRSFEDDEKGTAEPATDFKRTAERATDFVRAADDFVRAADFVHAADVPPEVRAVGLAQAAELAARHGRHERADELLAEAAAYAAPVLRGEQRATALALVTLSAARTGGVRVWELLPALVRAADEADELHFGAMRLEFSLGTPDGKLSLSVPEAPVSLPEVFAATARLDASRTLKEARSFKDEELRAATLLAAARATLEKNARAPGGRVR